MTTTASAPQHRRTRFGLLVGSVYRQWRRQIDMAFKDEGLSDATRSPLIALYDHGEPMRQKDLAHALYLDTSSLVRVLAYLRKSGLVDWQQDPQDRRGKLIALTPQGHATVTSILAKSLDIERTILADLTPEEFAATQRALQKISQRFQSMG